MRFLFCESLFQSSKKRFTMHQLHFHDIKQLALETCCYQTVYPSNTYLKLWVKHLAQHIHDHNRNLEISPVPTKAKSREPSYSQELFQNKIDRQRVKSRES